MSTWRLIHRSPRYLLLSLAGSRTGGTGASARPPSVPLLTPNKGLYFKLPPPLHVGQVHDHSNDLARMRLRLLRKEVERARLPANLAHPRSP